MAYIYKIVNDINDKIYIGKSEFNIHRRFKQHCRNVFDPKYKNSPLYRAMRLYGSEHFRVELVEKTDCPKEREIYWIKQYNSYKNGYNGTLGGDGKRYLDYEEIIDVYSLSQNMAETANRCRVSESSVRYVLEEHGVAIRSSQAVNREKTKKPVRMCSVSDNDMILDRFDSVHDAAKYLVNSGRVSVFSWGIVSHISAVCNGERKSAYGYFWQYDCAKDLFEQSQPNQKVTTSCAVAQYDLNHRLLRTFESYSAAARHLVDAGDASNERSIASAIGKVVRGKQKSCRGYIWKAV